MIAYLTDFLSIFAIIFLVSWICLSLPFFNNKKIFTKVLLIFVVGIFCQFVPIYNGFNLVRIIRGIIGDLSTTSFIVLIMLIIENVFNLKPSVLKRNTLLLISILGIALYLTTFAIIPVDLYGVGYYPKYALIGFIIFELYFLYTNRVIAWVWLIALISFYLKLQDSSNLFDYLLDPILTIIALLKLITRSKEKSVE